MPEPTPTILISPEFTQTEELSLHPADHCVVTATAVAFLDVNENGEWDEEEVPLPNILFHLTPSGSSNANVLTNLAGEAYLTGPYGPCDGIRVFAEPPPNLRLTTPAAVIFPSGFDGIHYYFGFNYKSGIATPTSISQSDIACDVAKTEITRSLVTDIQIDPSGHVWISTIENLYVDLPGLGTWKEYLNMGGLGLSIIGGGKIVSGFGDIEIFDGSDWLSIPWNHGPVLGAVTDLNDDLWLLDNHGLNRFDAGYELVESYPVDGYVDNSGSMTITADDTLWTTGISRDELHALSLQDRSQGDWDFDIYDFKEMQVGLDNRLQNAVAAPNGSIWFTTGSWFHAGGQVVNLDPNTDKWTVYDSGTTNYALATHRVNSVAVSPDGSIWLAGGFYGLIHLIPAESGEPEEAIIETYLPLELHGQYLTAVGIERPGVIWAGSENSAFRCVISNH